MINSINRYICNQQKELFEYVAERNGDVKRFAKDFLCSSFCKREIDAFYSVFQFADIEDWIDFFLKENDIHYIEDLFPTNIAGWTGFTYRYLHFATGVSSKDIYERIPVEKLIVSYPGLHSIDEEMSCEILCNNFGFTIL